MKRLAIVCFLAFWFWSAIPAGANSVPSIAIACDQVSVTWSRFPARPVTLHVRVEQGDAVTAASVSTDGQPDGDASVPVQLLSGEAIASVSWTLKQEHHAGPVAADLDCDVTTSTTEPSTTTSVPITGTSNSIPVTSAPPECGPSTLPCTGAESTTDWLVFGAALLGMGALLIAAARSRRASR